MTFYLHHVPGRLRIQTGRLQASEEAARIACDIGTIDGVTETRANTTTGSLVILYDPRRLAPASLWDALRERGLVSGAPPIGEGAQVTRIAIAEALNGPSNRNLLGAVVGLTAEKLLERCAAALIGAII